MTLTEAVQKAAYEDSVIENMTFTDEYLDEVSGKNVEFAGCVFEKCSFTPCDVGRFYFVDCTFKRCDLSGMNFRECTFQRVRFSGCQAFSFMNMWS